MGKVSLLKPYRNIPVLLYHQIAETTPRDDRLQLGVSPGEFDAQMRYLHESGYRTIGLGELSAHSLMLPSIRSHLRLPSTEVTYLTSVFLL